MRLQALRSLAQLRAITLRLAFVDPDAVVDEGELPARRVAVLRGRIDEPAALTHEIRLGNGMQGYLPGGLRAFLSDQRNTRPAEHGDHLAQAAGMRAMQFFESRVITFI